MKKIITAILLLISVSVSAQIDSLKERINSQDEKLNGIDERLSTDESDLSKLKKIKVSGYIQSQFELYQSDLVKANGPFSTFYIRRARVKVTYEATDGIKFVLQPDYSTGNLALKDAYAVANIPHVNGLAVWMGQFNRPNYEVEYSSSSREVLERSKVIRAIYPGEREIGAKIEYQPKGTPIKLQLAVLNGNFTGTEAKDIDTRKDVMARAVYSFKFPSSGIGIDIGAHAYLGGVVAQGKYVYGYDSVAVNNKINIDSTSYAAGSSLDKKWGGAEIQAYFDFLGGMSIKGEYLQGKNVFLNTPSSPNYSSVNSKSNPCRLRNFQGYYVYLIKNIGNRNQFVVKYDFFNPNTKVSGDGKLKDELSYSTFTLGWQYYLDDNIRITFQYEMPKNETNAAQPTDLKDNTFAIRLQAKF